MFNISFVVVTVRARLPGFPRHLEEAAMDLGANEWTTFWKITFPLILPGIMAAACSPSACPSTTTSSPPSRPARPRRSRCTSTASQQRGIPVQVNVIGTIIFVIAVGLVLLTTLWQRRVVGRDSHRRLPTTRTTEAG